MGNFHWCNFRIIGQNTLRINFRSFKSTALVRVRSMSGRFANIPHADKGSHPGSIEDGIFFSGSDGERLPACCSGET